MPLAKADFTWPWHFSRSPEQARHCPNKKNKNKKTLPLNAHPGATTEGARTCQPRRGSPRKQSRYLGKGAAAYCNSTRRAKRKEHKQRHTHPPTHMMSPAKCIVQYAHAHTRIHTQREGEGETARERERLRKKRKEERKKERKRALRDMPTRTSPDDPTFSGIYTAYTIPVPDAVPSPHASGFCGIYFLPSIPSPSAT